MTPPQFRELFHGTNGDNIMEIIRHGQFRPNRDGKIFFSERRFDSVLMHGADSKRKATFAIKARVIVPPDAAIEKVSTAGVSDTLIIATAEPLQAEVLELYVREPRAMAVTTIKGRADIMKFLSSRGA